MWLQFGSDNLSALFVFRGANWLIMGYVPCHNWKLDRSAPGGQVSIMVSLIGVALFDACRGLFPTGGLPPPG